MMWSSVRRSASTPGTSPNSSLVYRRSANAALGPRKRGGDDRAGSPQWGDSTCPDWPRSGQSRGRAMIRYRSNPPDTADLVVVGGGVAGAATAFHAARAGLRTVLLERRPALCTLT